MVFCAQPPEIMVGVVLLAAGQSRRMGQPKLLMAWAGTTILGHLLRQWGEVKAAQVAVVCAPELTAISQELDRLGHPPAQRILNSNAEAGMFSSIQCAARWAGWHESLTHWAVVLGDQPQLRLDTLRTLIAFSATHSDCVCQPAWAGRRCHPVILPRAVWAALRDAPAATLKDFLRPYSVRSCPIGDPGLALDLDYPEDYEKAVRLFGGSQRGLPGARR